MNRTTRSLIALIAALAFFLIMTKLFFLDMIVVRGRSMEPTFKEGTPIFINKLAFGLSEPFHGAFLVRWGGPARADVVVFRNPEDGRLAVKRCLAVAGDALRVVGHELEFGGRRIPLKYYQEAAIGESLTVPPGTVFLVGDNPDHSADSRTYGPVATDRLLGAVLFPPPPRSLPGTEPTGRPEVSP
ncbi:MAG: signal peptidase I [Spirochaetales bacterium]|nr:signal peptidase I [Spirochaetales bacterium]